jgi:hypothetical protein
MSKIPERELTPRMVPEKYDVGSTEWCQSGCIKERPDFVSILAMVIIEVDEHQHMKCTHVCEM